MDVRFGTSGVRGLVEDLVDFNAYAYTKAFCVHALKSGATSKGAIVYIGRDKRQSSELIARIVQRAVLDEGLTPINCEEISTPALALHAINRKSLSIMVTGSHIPDDRNGIKYYFPDGEILKYNEQEISSLVGNINHDKLNIFPSLLFRENAQVDYLRRSEKILAKNALLGLKVGVYEHSSVAKEMLKEVLRFYGAETISFGRSDRFIPVDTELVDDETCTRFKNWTTTHNLDAIVSTDGDGDRPLVADEYGEIVRGDLLGLIAAQFLDAKCIVTPITTNSGLVEKFPHAIHKTKVGSPFVIEKMKELIEKGEQNVVGFETNGGFIVGSKFRKKNIDSLMTRDCMVPILAILYSAAKNKRVVSEVCADYMLPSALGKTIKNIDAERSQKLISLFDQDENTVSEILKPIGSIKMIDRLDGIRIDFYEGCVFHIRPSGNAPEIRLYAEAEFECEAMQILETGAALVEKVTA